jgi:proline iminopeptidase
MSLLFPSLVRALLSRVAFVAAAGSSCAQLPITPPKLPEGQTVMVAGAKLWYLSEGQGNPLVLISGGPGAAHYLYPYFSALADRYRVIYLDSYGSGKSDRATTPSGYTFMRHVDEIEGFRQALGLGPINLLGHSYGSMVVQAFAAKYPKSLQRLVIACPFAGGEDWQIGNESVLYLVRTYYPELWKKISALRARGLRESDKELANAYGEIPEALLYYANVSNAGRLVLDYNFDVALGLGGPDPDFVVGGEIAGLDLVPRLKSIVTPTLVIAARHDRVALPYRTLRYKEFLPAARFEMFELSGHNFFLEENAKMIALLRDFLAK